MNRLTEVDKSAIFIDNDMSRVLPISGLPPQGYADPKGLRGARIGGTLPSQGIVGNRRKEASQYVKGNR